MDSLSEEGFVDVASGWVGRTAFTSDDVYRRETERIFDRSWIFLAHETEIPNPGGSAAPRSSSCATTAAKSAPC